MSSGKIVQIIGAVVDVEFSRTDLPKVYDALTVESVNLVLEVQQQLGDGVVRTIAMGSTDGLSRGLPYILPKSLCYPEMVGNDYSLFYNTDEFFLTILN